MAQFETEFCIGTLEGCRIAESLGATRVELCSALSVGGLTPSLGMIRQARQLCHNTKLHVLIRPRDGDFLYNKDELAVIVEDVKLAREAGANGVAVGCLNPDGTVDLDAMQQIIAVAGDMAITFHRAFDVCADQVQAFQELLKLGRISRILTSGGYPTAMEGVEQLKLLQQQAQGTSLAIMAASGVNEKNVVQIAEQSGVHQFHFSAKGYEPSAMSFIHSRVSFSPDGGFVYRNQVTDRAIATATQEAVKAYFVRD